MSDTHVTQSKDPAPPVEPGRGWFRALVLRLHFYVGIFIGPLILAAAVSGTLYAIAPQAERIVFQDQLNSRTTGAPLPLTEQVATARAVLPDLQVQSVRPAPEAGATTRVMFADPTLAASETRSVFIDPATATSQGVLVTYGTSGSLPLRTWLSNLHRSLHLGDPGRHYSELAASWLWVIALSGIVLWFNRIRRSPRSTESTPGRTRAWTRRLHGRVGAVALIGMLGLSVTGLTWSIHAGAKIEEVRSQLSWLAPAVDTGAGEAAGHSEHAGHGQSGLAGDDLGHIDHVVAAAREGGINAAKIEVAPAAAPDAAWTVTEVDRGWPTQVDVAAVDPATMQVTDIVRFEDYPFMAKMARWGIDIHMGSLFGVVNELALMALGIALITLILLGYRMLWQRRPTRGEGLRLPRAYPRGSLRQAPWPALLGIGAITALIGWSMPLLGLSLLAFLALDMLLGIRSQRRALGSS
ncbi:PepSY-associated TM helix domain-containing protein [Demetria terragena]|uniref:PepSY-associated TM helix domain-containing protein n=1 Tax=Demetria terragena TaxID=63959 RepID=UPI00035E6D72|nr:PepSY-associated TM helix domain-containing protein [Demetria terragena]